MGELDKLLPLTVRSSEKTQTGIFSIRCEIFHVARRWNKHRILDLFHENAGIMAKYDKAVV